jgi:hypothetical protein
MRTYLNPAIDGLVAVVWFSTFFFTIWQNPEVSLARLFFDHGIFVFAYFQLIFFAYIRYSRKAATLTALQFRIRLWQLHWAKISLAVLFSVLVLFFTAQPQASNATDYKLLQLFTPLFVLMLAGTGWWYIGYAGKRISDSERQP